MTVTYAVAAAAVLLVVLLVARAVLRRDPRDHVDRFHAARTMTTRWAQEYHGGQVPGQAYPPDAAEPVADRDSGREAGRG